MMPRPPGRLLLALARHVIDPPTVARVLEPLVADWQREWLAATSPARRALARGRGVAAFLTTSAYCVMTEPVPAHIHHRATTPLVVFSAIGLVVVMPPLGVRYVSSLPTASVLPMLALLVPSSLTLSLPFAVLPLAMKLGGMRIYPQAGARHLLHLTMAIIVFVFVMHNWVTPYANRAFRTRALAMIEGRAMNADRPVGLGARELTLPELLTIDARTPRVISSPRQLREERHNRAALPLVPIALAMLGWNLRRTNGPAGRLRIIFWWMFIASTFGAARSLGMTFERVWHLPREIAIWLPLVLWVATSAALISWRRRGLGDVLERA